VVSDAWIGHPSGRLFSRRWHQPREDPPTGKKTPIVLFHDSLGCVDLWRDFPALLSVATGRDVVAYDRLGFGRSDRRTGRLPLDFIADEATSSFRAVAEELGLGRFIAFGHSVGDETREGLLEAKWLFADEQQLARLQTYHDDKAGWVLDAWIGTWLDPAFASWSLREVLPAVKCPVLAIHGALDEYGSPRHPETIAGHCGGPAQIHILPETHHVPHKERTKEIVELVAEFTAKFD
jgi:pimeloyl-ACP methyl ester carboxylesterase